MNDQQFREEIAAARDWLAHWRHVAVTIFLNSRQRALLQADLIARADDLDKQLRTLARTPLIPDPAIVNPKS